MRHIQSPLVLSAAVGYLLLNYLWLWAANTAGLDESVRSTLKWLVMGAAALVFTAMAAYIAMKEEADWMRRTATNAGAAVALGIILIILSSLVWYRGQVFHDATLGERWPSLLGIVIGLAASAAALAWVPGVLARILLRVSPQGSTATTDLHIENR